MHLTAIEAKAILQEAHSAWSVGDVDGTLACYCEELTYVCNTGGLDGQPLMVCGKAQFREFLLPVMEAVDSSTTISQFKFNDPTGRALIDCTLRHRKTGLELVGKYTQAVTFKRGRIWRLDELHDVARMAAFWQLVLSEEEAPTAKIIRPPVSGEGNRTSWRQQLPSKWRPTS